MEINLFSDEQILKLADFCLNETWDIYDSKFGPRTHGDICTKCKKHCSGHYAYLNIGSYICHPLFKKDLEIKLNNMCISCGSNVYNLDETKCPKCNTKISRNYYVTKDGTVLRKPSSKSTKDSGIKIPLEKVRSALEKNFKIYKKSNLSNYILRYIIIPPIQTRSPEDPEYMSDLSTKYTRLVNYAKKDDIPNIYHTYSKILGTKRTEGMGKFLSGKNGIFRDIMLGKRTERSARSVITGDPCLDYNTIFLPKYISDNIRIPVKIHKYNRKHLSKHAKLFLPNDDDPIDDPNLIFVNQNYERLLSDNDDVILNRQPSLTNTSVLGFKVKIRTDDIKTISINPLVTPFFNADFDGDEMNIFVIPEIEQEFDILLEVTNTKPSPPIQDTITGAYLMTVTDDEILPEIFMDCFLLCKQERFPKNIRFIGKNLFRLALPDGCDTNIYNDEVVTKSVLSSIIKKLSSKQAVRFVFNLQKICIRYLHWKGLSTISTECHSPNTGLKSMVASGAKGNDLNLTQISKQLGQQYMYGEPVKCQLPYKYSDDLDTQLQNGYINSSYVKGLNPYEFFVHQMAAREGIVNTGVSTASTGYLNRRACKLMGDIKIMYNKTIGTDNCTIRITDENL